jgi:hypothetical protein
MPRLKNASIDAVISKACESDDLPTSEDVRGLWDKASDSSPMRKLLADLFARTADIPLNFAKRIFQTFSSDFLASIICAMDTAIKDGSTGSRDFWEIRCQYHSHEDSSTNCA